MYTTAELIILARLYLEETEVPTPRLSLVAFGNNKTLSRLLVGNDCYAQQAERASSWFDGNWPLHVPWPASVPRAAGRFRLEGRRRGPGAGSWDEPGAKAAMPAGA